MSTGWTPCAQCASAIACITRGCAALAASPQPAAQPEQPEPGVLTDERIAEIFNERTFWNGSHRMLDDNAIARAIEREVLATTRKRFDAEVAKKPLQRSALAKALDSLQDAAKELGAFNALHASFDSLQAGEENLRDARAEVERLLRGEA